MALQQMGFNKNKDSINNWRIEERKILKSICDKYNFEIYDEERGRGKTFTPKEYKRIRDEVKREIEIEPQTLEEIKNEFLETYEKKLNLEHEELNDKIKNYKVEINKANTLYKKIAKTRREVQDSIKLYESEKERLEGQLEALKDETILISNKNNTLDTDYKAKKIKLEKELLDLRTKVKNIQMEKNEIISIRPVKGVFGTISGDGITVENIEKLKKMALFSTKAAEDNKKLKSDNKKLKLENQNLQDQIPTLEVKIKIASERAELLKIKKAFDKLPVEKQKELLIEKKTVTQQIPKKRNSQFER